MKLQGTTFECDHCGHVMTVKFHKPSRLEKAKAWDACPLCDAQYEFSISAVRGSRGREQFVEFVMVGKPTPWWRRIRRILLGVA